MEEPQGPPRLFGADEEGRVVGRARLVQNVLPESALHQSPPAATRAVLNELFDLRVGELEAGQRFDDLVRQGKVVYERVRSERQNHLGCGKLSQNTGHQLQCHLGEPQLVEEEDRPPGSRLPSVDFRKDALHGTLEGLRVEDDVLVVVL